ncbi:MAG: VWA domain-containing protein [Acidobacteria bacterium]|nr:MAG: VWA domain-containing protein [Acidobacteriota bacterium]
MSRRRLLVAAVLLALASAGALVLAARPEAKPSRQQQQAPPTFRTGTRTVPVFVTVTDASGRLVPDLNRGDFEILDNGQSQEITVFANQIQPITVVVLLDRSVSMALEFRTTREAAAEFVRQLLPEDKARIGSFSTGVQLDPPAFTNDHATLLEIIEYNLLPMGPTPLWNALNAGIDTLRDQQGRRVILVFTDGTDEPGPEIRKRASQKDVMTRAREEDVMVYGVGLRGYRQQGPAKPDPGLRKVAAETGGGYFELKSSADLATTFTRVADELHRQYALGFEPSSLDGKIHALEVRVKREGMTARARRSYVAPTAR